jgi:hypothetical protein
MHQGNQLEQYPSNMGEPMRHARRTDFLFIGLGILPVVLAYAGHPDVAIMLFVPLLIAACLCGMHEKAGEQAVAKPGSAEEPDAGNATQPRLPAALMEPRRAPDA